MANSSTADALAIEMVQDLFGGQDAQVSPTLPNPDQPDLFVPMDAVHDWPVKDDMSTMEYPIFSLGKNHDTRIRTYSRGGKTVKVIPSAYGAATIFDKDILIYCLSQIIRATKDGLPVSRRVRIDTYPFLVGTRRSTGGAAYTRVLDMCRRLRGTTIETNVKSSEQEQTEGFGLIEDYKVVQHTKNGKGALTLEIMLSDWLYRHAINYDVLTLHPDYFSLSQPLERRLYELARKHCGDKAWWYCSLTIVHEKTGSSQSARRFKQDLKEIIARDSLPDYRVALDESSKPNQVVFLTRDGRKLMVEAQKAGKIPWVMQFLQPKLA